MKEPKKGDKLIVDKTESLLQMHPIEGIAYFDSWASEHCIFITLPNEPSGKRFVIDKDKAKLCE